MVKKLFSCQITAIIAQGIHLFYGILCESPYFFHNKCSKLTMIFILVMQYWRLNVVTWSGVLGKENYVGFPHYQPSHLTKTSF